jgi:hypothetical protein
MSRLLGLFALLLGSAAAAAAPLHLQALTPTSGTGAELLLDGNPATGWRPEGDPRYEGVLLRLEKPLVLEGLSVRACTGAAPLSLVVSVDTAPGGHVNATPDQTTRLTFEKPREVRSLFLLMDSKASARPCLGEVQLLQGGKPLAVAPPRTVQGRVQASSVLAPPEAYAPAYLFDGRPDFGWVEGAKGTGEGESVTLTLDAPVELTALELWNGYQRSDDHFQKNARAGQLALSVDGGAPVVLAVKDTSGPQTLALPAPVKGTTFRLTVQKARAGKRYPDLVLSELRLVDRQGPLGVKTLDGEERRKALEAALAGSPLREVVNRSWTSRCEPDSEDAVVRALKLRTNHTFVVYENQDVLDGAWVVQKTGKPWSTVEIFGRQNRASSEWQPYSDTPARDTTRVVGGKLEIARVADLDEKTFRQLVSRWSAGDLASMAWCIQLSDEEADAAGGELDASGRKQYASYADLVKEGAIIVRGAAMTDVMVP